MHLINGSSYMKFIILFLNLVFLVQVGTSQRVIKLSESVNSPYDEVTPILSQDEKALYFTRIGHPIFNKTLIHNGEYVTDMMAGVELEHMMRGVYENISGNYIPDPISSRFNQDIWVVELSEEYTAEQVHHLPYPINNIYPNSVLAIHDDQLLIINEFTEDGAVYEGISSISMEGESDMFPKPLDMSDFYTKDNEVNLTMNKRGDVMIIALNRGDSYNSRDLYVSFLVANKYWTPPKNLGPDINTNFRESTPFLASDGKRLYFSSDRPGSLGGMDIFYSDRLDYSWQNWSEVKSLPAPINSEFNDSQPCLTKDENYVFFSSDRDGDSDIFLFDKNYQAEMIDEPIVLNILVIDSITQEPLSVTFNYGLRDRKEKNLPDFFRSATGRFTTEIKSDIDLEFKILKSNYEQKFISFGYWDLFDKTINQHNLVIELSPKDFNHNKTISSNDSPQPKTPQSIPEKNKVIEVEKQKEIVSLDGIDYEIESSMILRNIYFVRSKPQVLARSHKALEKLYKEILSQETESYILITGHTDNVGSYTALMKLSLERALAIKKYLVEKGISPERIHTKGLGPDKPLNLNQTEYQKQQNRRVEISYLKKEKNTSYAD